ncbi:hypothetical protein PUR71_07330 [Streptomyces sp. SP17BM10]|uniref:hypothetical protein n=1 Tax=Streptomyces sp. SP17BM10 TaxID=3002530 RepID=UPI002E77D6AA|nr:hypothetical protein [Streptomyces sp. SP17BM10]MEE1782731.1 hypothetical protein [Streptomyces sp. SP17BM10]
MKKAVAGVFAGAVLAGVVGAAPASATGVDPGQSSVYCEPVTNRYYEQTGWDWSTHDSGTVSNNSGASISRAIARTNTGTLSATVSAEVSVSGNVLVTEIQATLGLSVTASATVSSTDTFTVNVPAWTTVRYNDGIINRRFGVRIVHTYSNCQTSTSWGTATAPERYSEVYNA